MSLLYPWPQRPRSQVIVPRNCAGEWLWFWDDARFVVPMLDVYQLNAGSGNANTFLEDVVSRKKSTCPNTVRLENRPEMGRVMSGVGETGRIEWVAAETNIGALTRPFSVTVVTKGGPTSSKYIFESGFGVSLVAANTTWTLWCDGTGSSDRVGTSNVTLLRDGNWHLSTFVAEQGNDRVYIDGVRNENSDTTQNDPTLGIDLTLMASTTGGLAFRNDLAFVAVLNRGISDAQARQWARDPWGPCRPRPNPFGRSLHILGAAPPATRNRAMVCS